MGWMGGNEKEYPGEMQFFQKRLGGDQMTVVDGIERAAQNAKAGEDRFSVT